jgi:hypothetical protein
LFKLREQVQERYPESGKAFVERIDRDATLGEQLGLPLRPKTDTARLRVVPSVPKGDQYTKAVPVYDLAVAAGKFSVSQSPEATGWMYVESTVPLDKLIFVARVVGKSMEKAIPSGSWALFRFLGEGASPSAIDGRRVVIQLRETDPDTGGQYTLKRLHVTRRGDDGAVEQIELRSDNTDFEAIALSSDAEIRAVAEFLELVAPK